MFIGTLAKLENEYMNVVEAGSEDEALEKCAKEDKVIEKLTKICTFIRRIQTYELKF